MIAESRAISLSSVERSQLDRKRFAIDVWREGRIKDALLIIDVVLSEKPPPRVAGECYIAQAAFRIDDGDLAGSWQSIEKAAPLVDLLDTELRASFYLQRARIHKESARYDAALTDYSGAEMYWHECGQTEKAGAAALNLAGCYLAIGDLSAAHENLDRAFKLFRLTKSFYVPEAHDTRAQIFLAEGKLEQAARSIRVALEIVGDSNEQWRTDFLVTLDKVEACLLTALQVKKLPDCDHLRIGMVRRALRASKGSPAGAALFLGVTRHAIESLINNHPAELEPYRMKRRIRYKTIIKRA